MHEFLDICQGIGLGAAAGVRPFLAAITAGIFAIANWGVDFGGTRYSFLESPVWLVALAVLLVVTFALNRDAEPSASTDAAVGGLAIGIGALLFAGTLADDGHTALGWTVLGLAGGALVALLAQAAIRDLSARTGQRLDPQARRALPLWFEGVALVLAALSIAVPPVALVAVPFLAWLLAGGRRRDDSRYAGLRILR